MADDVGCDGEFAELLRLVGNLEEHVEHDAFHDRAQAASSRAAFHGELGDVLEVFSDPPQKVKAVFRPAHLAHPEHDGHLDVLALIEEFAGTPCLGLEVMDGELVKVAGKGAELKLKVKVGNRLPKGVLFAPYHFAEAQVARLYKGEAVVSVKVSK